MRWPGVLPGRRTLIVLDVKVLHFDPAWQILQLSLLCVLPVVALCRRLCGFAGSLWVMRQRSTVSSLGCVEANRQALPTSQHERAACQGGGRQGLLMLGGADMLSSQAGKVDLWKHRSAVLLPALVPAVQGHLHVRIAHASQCSWRRFACAHSQLS